MRVFALLLLIATTLPSIGQEKNPSSTVDGETNAGTTLHVNVRLVNVFVSVTDANGAPYTNLSKDNFSLYEDGVPQRIALFDRESELPLSIVACIDTSLSTRKDLELEVLSARKFARSILRPVD